ncbi:hypothetical protein F5888DRAFT_1848234 [Russula emetica]|nr:hypothetical protein F5888DRAFT_1848234 [Russula emetica]
MTMQTRSCSSHSPTSDNNGLAVNPRKNVRWDLNEEAELIRFLSGKQGEMSGKSFKEPIFRQAADTINDLPKSGQKDDDPKKNTSLCKSKWSHLKTTYDTVIYLKSLSGFTWSNETGMSITTDDNKQQWEELTSWQIK